jgi:hypothetical protein
LSRRSIANWLWSGAAWMAGTSPAMTVWELQQQLS